MPELPPADDIVDVAEPGPTSARLDEAMFAYDVLYDSDHAVGVGNEVVRGRAVVVATPEEAIDRVGPDTVLVVRTTAPAYDPVLALTCAVVCEEGGLLSHAALAARELGIAAVVGLHNATTSIPDGAVVDVDPIACVVRVVD